MSTPLIYVFNYNIIEKKHERKSPAEDYIVCKESAFNLKFPPLLVNLAYLILKLLEINTV